MENYLVYVIDKSFTIRKASELFLRNECEVLTFENSQEFNLHISNQKESFPYIIIAESSIADKIIRNYNPVIILATKSEAISELGDWTIYKPFTKSDLIDAVQSLKGVIIKRLKEFLDSDLPSKNVENTKKVKI